MTRVSIRGRALTLLAVSLVFPACAPLPTSDANNKSTPISPRKKKPVASPKASTGPVSASTPIPLGKTDGTVTKPSETPDTTPNSNASASPSPSPSASASVSPSPSPSVSPSPSPSVSPSPSPSPSASVSPSPSPSPSVSTIPSAVPLLATTVNGKVFDEEGAPLNGAKVRIQSLNPSFPFDSIVDTINGAWVANQVPAGVLVEITASREGWTTRRRVESLLPLGEDRVNEVNFGGIVTANDEDGPAYFISDFPEVSMVEPGDDPLNVNHSVVTVKLTLSEALDSTNQRRFADSIHVLPGNVVAAGNTGTPDENFLDDDEKATTAILPFTLANTIYAVSEDSTFLGDVDTQAQVTWDAEGKVATLSFDAPLLASSDDTLPYTVALFCRSEAIEDPSGNQLGTNETGVLNGVQASDELIYFAFRNSNPTVSADDSANGRWRSTHENFYDFFLAEDETDPVLTGVSVTNPEGLTRINLSFSEPMAAYGGGDQGLFGSVEFMDLTMAVGETAADLEDVDLDGEPALTRFTGETVGDTSAEREVEFALENDPDAPMTLFANPADPKVLRLDISNPFLFDDAVGAIIVRAEGFEDPAGNIITESSADNNTKVGSI